MLNTLAYARRLKSVGFTEAQAEAQAEALLEAVQENLVSKSDLQDAEHRLEARIDALQAETKIEFANIRSEIAGVRGELGKEIETSRAETIRWMVAVGVLQTGLIAALVLKLATP